MDIMYSNILVDSTTHKIAHPSRLDYLKIDIKQTLSPKQKLNKLKFLKIWNHGEFAKFVFPIWILTDI